LFKYFKYGKDKKIKVIKQAPWGLKKCVDWESGRSDSTDHPRPFLLGNPNHIGKLPQ
jgi:hypothetical protein